MGGWCVGEVLQKLMTSWERSLHGGLSPFCVLDAYSVLSIDGSDHPITSKPGATTLCSEPCMWAWCE